MELVGEILPVLVALYLVDSALLVRAGQVLFVSGWGGRFEARGPGLRLPGLLPIAEAVVAASLPLRACADGVFVPTAANASASSRSSRCVRSRPTEARSGSVPVPSCQ